MTVNGRDERRARGIGLLRDPPEERDAAGPRMHRPSVLPFGRERERMAWGEKATVPLSFYADPAMAAALDQAAAWTGTSRSYVMRDVIRSGLAAWLADYMAAARTGNG